MKKRKWLQFLTFSVMLVMWCCSMAWATEYIPETRPSMGDEFMKGLIGNLIGSLRWIGYVIAIGMLIFIGIKYVMSSADEKASMKGVLIKVVVGALIIVFANTIVNAVLSMAGR